MAKHGLGTSSRRSKPRADRKIHSSPKLGLAATVEIQKTDQNLTEKIVEILAAGEKSQLEFQKIFGFNLKEARLKSNLKQSDVAEITGLPQQYLSLIEAGRQNVTIKTMALLAEVVDHDLVDLLKHALGLPSKED